MAAIKKGTLKILKVDILLAKFINEAMTYGISHRLMNISHLAEFTSTNTPGFSA